MRTLLITLFFLISITTYSQYVVNDAFKKSTLYIPNITVSGPIGTAFETVDHFSSFVIDQTSSSKVFTLPTPNDATDGDDVTIRNTGSANFTMYNIVIYPDSFELHLSWKDGAWKPVGNYFQEGASSCPCCDEILYYDSDTAAYYQGRVNKDEYYLTSASHLEGLGKGIYKQVPENYGWELFTSDSISFGFNSLIVKSKNTTRVGFDAAFLGPCRLEPPAVDLQYYESDLAAKTAGLSIGESYLLNISNLYGLPKDWIKKITEP